MKEILPAILVNIRCGSHQAITFQRCQQRAQRRLSMETECPPSSHTLQPSPDAPLRKLQVRNHRTLASESWEVPMEATISASPDFSIFPYREKHKIPPLEMSGFLWLTVIFSYSDYLVFVAKTPMHPGSAHVCLKQSLRAIWDARLWALSP